MKIGDKILVTYSNGDQFAGRIYGETAKSWKVEFDSGDKRTIRKTMAIDVIPEDETVEEKVPVEEVVEEVVEEAVPYEPTKYVPSKKLKRKNVVILIGILLGAATVAALLLYGIGIF